MTGGDWARAIIHLDLDAFYASVEQLRRPELRGQPVIVGGWSDESGRLHTARGVVCAASYEARRWGVRSAMPLATALRLCPQARVVPVDFGAYRAASTQVFALARTYTPMVEPLSLDEAYLDVTASQRRFGAPQSIAAELRDSILDTTRLHASFGVATVKVVAKVASDLRKPRGLVVVEPGEEAAFLAPLSLRRLPGLGPAAERALQGLGVSTLGQLAALPLDVVQRRLGQAAGRMLWERAHGEDDSAVSVPGRPKSISREETFAHDLDDAAALNARLHELAADVGRRLRQGGWCARTVTLRMRYGDFSTLTRQLSLPAPTEADLAIAGAARGLLENCWTGSPLRLVGVGVSGLEDASQLDLFARRADRDTRVDRMLDQLHGRFGHSAPRRGAATTLRDLDFRGDDLRGLSQDSTDKS